MCESEVSISSRQLKGDTHYPQNDYSPIEDLSKKELEAIPELVRILINNAMYLQRNEHLKPDPMSAPRSDKTMPTVINIKQLKQR